MICVVSRLGLVLTVPGMCMPYTEHSVALNEERVISHMFSFALYNPANVILTSSFEKPFK